MADITLQGLTARQLAMLGDAALQAGDLPLARGLYRNLVRAAPGWTGAHVRNGLTQRPSARTRPMLEVLRTIEAAVPNAEVFVGEGLATWLKTPPFSRDAKFMELAEKDFEIAPSGISNWHWNLMMVLCAAQQARALPGDFVELGVYKGHTTKFLAEYLGFDGWSKRWWLYDTFDGVPADQQDPGRNITAASYGLAFSYEEVRDRFAPWSNITVTKGRVPEVLAEVCPDAVAFMHIDLNNATAEVAALDALYDKLVPGGVIVFDDFLWQSSNSQREAETAWFGARGLTVFPLPTGQGLFVKPPA
jgi:hypothetical protein